MANPDNLPYLLKLLDDDSPVVQESVLMELSSFGPRLSKELARLKIPVSEDQHLRMTSLLQEFNARWLLSEWPAMLAMTADKERLEKAMTLIGQFQYGRGYPVPLATLLNELAKEFRHANHKQNPLALAYFLFQTKRLRGTDSDYYNPLNSNLVYVIEERRGIPISLACIYILVGHRLGFDVEGINMPGHFLARAIFNKQSYVVDCFNGGRCMTENEAVSWNHGAPVPIADLLPLECDSTTIIARALRNLINAYQQENHEPNMRLMTELLQMMNADTEDDETDG